MHSNHLLSSYNKLININLINNINSFKYFKQSIRYFYSNITKMAKSRFEYVKSFESEDNLLLNTYIVVRIDGKGFHRFT